LNPRMVSPSAGTPSPVPRCKRYPSVRLLQSQWPLPRSSACEKTYTMASFARDVTWLHTPYIWPRGNAHSSRPPDLPAARLYLACPGRMSGERGRMSQQDIVESSPVTAPSRRRGCLELVAGGAGTRSWQGP
ncbi:hypothetical protein CI238_03047, partial [Colletotrichum incanum]